MWLLFITTSGGRWPFCCSLVYNSCIWQSLFWSQVKLKWLQHEGYFLRLNTAQEHCLLKLSHLSRGRQWVVELFWKLLQLIEFSHCWIKNNKTLSVSLSLTMFLSSFSAFAWLHFEKGCCFANWIRYFQFFFHTFGSWQYYYFFYHQTVSWVY